MRPNHDADSGIVSFALAGEVTVALDQAAADNLESRSAFVRRLVVQHLRNSDLLSRNSPITPAGSRRRASTREAAL